MVTCKDVWKFQNSKVIVHFDGESGQPIGDSGGLLGSWIGQLSHDINLLPIMPHVLFQERNRNNQKKHTMPHVCGRKSFSRRRDEIVSNLVEL